FFPFDAEMIDRVARTEPTLRDMLQQFRHQFDHVVFGSAELNTEPPAPSTGGASRLPAVELPPEVKSFIAVETPAENVPAAIPMDDPPHSALRTPHPEDLWDQEVRSARRKLEPEGALTGATRELQLGLGTFLQVCHEHGVKVGPWRLQHVVGE